MDQAEVNEAYRAIGLYFVRFSQLVMRMRQWMAWRLTIGHDSMDFGELAFAAAMAQQITDSFFSMCRFDGKLDDDEQGVANLLHDAVNEQITHRNYFAHGDWWIGYDPTAGATPQLVRTTSKPRKGAFADLQRFPPDMLDARSEQISQLIADISDFGLLALGLPIPVPATDSAGWRISEGREYRVKDLFRYQAGQSRRKTRPGTHASFTRDGPLAGALKRRLGHYAP